jgi:hypothetical protein
MLVKLCGAFLDDPTTPPDVFQEAVAELRKQVKHPSSSRARRGAADVLLKHATRVAAITKDDGAGGGGMAIVINIQPPPGPGHVTVKPESVT